MGECFCAVRRSCCQPLKEWYEVCEGLAMKLQTEGDHAVGVDTNPTIDVPTLLHRVGRGETLIVQCTASWNADNDRAMMAALSEVVLETSGVRVFQLNADEETAWPLLWRWRVLNLPALVVLARGRHVGTLVGLRPVPELAATLADWLPAAAQPN
jgi:hypothetical protein